MEDERWTPFGPGTVMWLGGPSGPVLVRVVQDEGHRFVLANGATITREKVRERGRIGGDPLPGKRITPPPLSPESDLARRALAALDAQGMWTPDANDHFLLQELIKRPCREGEMILAGLRGVTARYEAVNAGALAFMDIEFTQGVGTVSVSGLPGEVWHSLRTFTSAEWAHVQACEGQLIPMVRSRKPGEDKANTFAILREVAEAELARLGVPAKREALLGLTAKRTGRGWGTKALHPLYQSLPPHLRQASRDPQRR